jgi:hypothetical protein
MSSTKKRVLIVAAVMAVVSGFFTTPDLITQIIVAISSFFLILGILLVCLRVLSMPSWSLVRQRVFTWLVAIGVAASVCLLPLSAPFALTGGVFFILAEMFYDRIMRMR